MKPRQPRRYVSVSPEGANFDRSYLEDEGRGISQHYASLQVRSVATLQIHGSHQYDESLFFVV
jgi:hypothetical protein